MPSYVTITPDGIELVGNLMKSRGKRARAKLPFSKTVVLPASDRLIQKVDGQGDCGEGHKVLFHDIVWVEVNMERKEVRVGTANDGTWFWDGAPRHIRFRAKGPVEEVVRALGGHPSDLQPV